jgi:hypothetical protein
VFSLPGKRRHDGKETGFSFSYSLFTFLCLGNVVVIVICCPWSVVFMSSCFDGLAVSGGTYTFVKSPLLYYRIPFSVLFGCSTQQIVSVLSCTSVRRLPEGGCPLDWTINLILGTPLPNHIRLAFKLKKAGIQRPTDNGLLIPERAPSMAYTSSSREIGLR